MNEEALKDAYNQFANTGYDGDQNEFYTLLSENSEAFADSYGLFKGSGYDGSEDDYKTLLGLKKKRRFSCLKHTTPDGFRGYSIAIGGLSAFFGTRRSV